MSAMLPLLNRKGCTEVITSLPEGAEITLYFVNSIFRTVILLGSSMSFTFIVFITHIVFISYAFIFEL